MNATMSRLDQLRLEIRQKTVVTKSKKIDPEDISFCERDDDKILCFVYKLLRSLGCDRSSSEFFAMIGEGALIICLVGVGFMGTFINGNSIFVAILILGMVVWCYATSKAPLDIDI